MAKVSLNSSKVHEEYLWHIKTNKGIYKNQFVVFAAGPWTIPELKKRLNKFDIENYQTS